MITPVARNAWPRSLTPTRKGRARPCQAASPKPQALSVAAFRRGRYVRCLQHSWRDSGASLDLTASGFPYPYQPPPPPPHLYLVPRLVAHLGISIDVPSTPASPAKHCAQLANIPHYSEPQLTMPCASAARFRILEPVPAERRLRFLESTADKAAFQRLRALERQSAPTTCPPSRAAPTSHPRAV